jgi:hypothetical protein
MFAGQRGRRKARLADGSCRPRSSVEAEPLLVMNEMGSAFGGRNWMMAHDWLAFAAPHSFTSWRIWYGLERRALRAKHNPFNDVSFQSPQILPSSSSPALSSVLRRETNKPVFLP